jgi:nicotinamide-nucleotide amidase
VRDGRNIERAEIVTVGTEMLLGDLVDTNTAWISQRLARLGVGIYRHTTIGDNSERIVAALRQAASNSDLVVTTGGLGPTSDDLTNACISTLTGREMVEYPEAREHVDRMFQKFGRKPTANNYKQALFPEGTELIPNPVGTAMGALVEWEGTLFATLPGVPTEMKSMFEATLEPLIRARSEGFIVSKTLHFAGIGESAVAEKVQEFLDATDPTVAPLAGQGRVRLRITTRAATEKEAQEKIAPVEKEVIARLKVQERGATLALAESCTGGLLAKRLTDMPGSSAYFGEGLVTYSNESKERLLGVPHDLIMEHGAVSEPVAGEMADGARRVSGADYGLSVTGIAGPDGGTEEKPVGLVFVGISDAEDTFAEKLDLTAWARSRDSIRERSANRAFDLLRLRLEENQS